MLISLSLFSTYGTVLDGVEGDEEESIDGEEKEEESSDSEGEEEEEKIVTEKPGITPLEMKVGRWATYATQLGTAASLIAFASLTIRYFTQVTEPGRTAQDKAQGVVTILVTAISIGVVAIREKILFYILFKWCGADTSQPRGLY